jgi:hypothetical protein
VIPTLADKGVADRLQEVRIKIMSAVEVTIVRTFLPHRLLLDAAFRALQAAKSKKEGCWWDWLTVILYSSLSIEAIGNTYGTAMFDRWDDFETCSPLAKIRLVAEKCGVVPDFSRSPWQIVPELVSFRNRIAHAKPEEINHCSIQTTDDYEKVLYAKPESKLEKMVTEHFAQKSYEAICAILGLLSEKLPPAITVKCELEMWHGGAGPANAT